MPEGHSAAQLVGARSTAILFSYSAGNFTAMSMSVCARACVCVCVHVHGQARKPGMD